MTDDNGLYWFEHNGSSLCIISLNIDISKEVHTPSNKKVESYEIKNPNDKYVQEFKVIRLKKLEDQVLHLEDENRALKLECEEGRSKLEAIQKLTTS